MNKWSLGKVQSRKGGGEKQKIKHSLSPPAQHVFMYVERVVVREFQNEKEPRSPNLIPIFFYLS